MNILSTKAQQTVVSLQELVPQHDCLKLLILHTPYTLQIDTLPLCINLVKLDLSKNHLQDFPHLGHLASLRFMFLHENKLSPYTLRNIFQMNGVKSVLSHRIVWVTFWGNPHAFLGRHYLANETSAIAVDQNMVTSEERSPHVQFEYQFETFSEKTDISHFFKKRTVNRHATEEEYMSQLWKEMRELRRKHQDILPIIKIQKFFRGWKVRNDYKVANQQLQEKVRIQSTFFKIWRQHTVRSQKLADTLSRPYLLIEGKPGRMQQICYKMIDWAHRAKKRVAAWKADRRHELIVYRSLHNNYQRWNHLYDLLQLKHSSAVYLLASDWGIFQKNILLSVAILHPEGDFSPIENDKFVVRNIYDSFSNSTSQLIKMIATNFKSSVVSINLQKKVIISQLRRGKKSLLYGVNLKPVYQAPHISTQKKELIAENTRLASMKTQFELEDLVKIQGNTRMLKDIIKNIFLFNTGALPDCEVKIKRIQIFSEAMLDRGASAVKIQKVWRGYQLRKKHEKYLRSILKMQRAAIRIQRWVRRLPLDRKKQFMFMASKRLEGIHDEYFYVEMEDYISFIRSRNNWKKEQYDHPSFTEQLSRVYLDRKARLLVLGWDHQCQDSLMLENARAGKLPFSKNYYAQYVGFNEDQLKSKLTYNSNKHETCDVAHLFHYQAQTTIIRKKERQFIEIKCSSRAEARFRTLIIKLLTYSPKEKIGLPIFVSQQMGRSDSTRTIDPAHNGTNFLSNQSGDLLKLCERKMSSYPHYQVHIITNRFYISRNDSKPLRNQQKIYLFTTQEPEPAKINAPATSDIQIKYERRYKTEMSQPDQPIAMLTEIVPPDTQGQEQFVKEKLKKIIMKRSMKQFKIDKRLKQKKQQPSFILDSISINDRLTTQPEVLQTQPSNAEHQVPETNLRGSHHYRGSSNLVLSAKKAESINIDRSMSYQKRQPRLTYDERKINESRRKEQQNFTKRFINLGNFIQNQFANDYRRKQKIQSHHNATESADNIRRSIERSHSQRIEKMAEKLRDVREKHSHHREMVSKNDLSLKEQALKLKNHVSEERERKQKEKSKIKRLKVTFAEECYPLGKNKPQEYVF